MTDPSKDLGVAMALLERLTTQTLPKLSEIKERVDRGEQLDHWDLTYLHEVLENAEAVKPLIDRHPEYEGVYAGTVHLYKEITERALQNEQGSAPSV